MQKILLSILFVAALSGCTDDFSRFNHRQNIPRQKFVNILTEIHIMEVVSGRNEFYKKYSSRDSILVFDHIIEKYGYTTEEFDSTVASYSRRPVLYEKVYNQVLMKLNYMVDTLRKNDPKFERIIMN